MRFNPNFVPTNEQVENFEEPEKWEDVKMTVSPICRSKVTATSAANLTELGTIWETEEKEKTLTGMGSL